MSIHRICLFFAALIAVSAFQLPTYRLETLIGADMPDEVAALAWNFNGIIRDLAVDRNGDVWVFDELEIRKLTRDGRLVNVPVKGSVGGSCDMSTPRLNPYYRLTVGPDGLPYVSDPWCDVVWRISSDGTQEIFAGRFDRGETGDGGPAKQATLGQIGAITFDAAGNLYIAEQSSGRIRKVGPRGIITHVAGGREGQQFGSPRSRSGALPACL